MKKWRLEAASINARRAAGSKEPTARVQKNQEQALARAYPKMVSVGNFLLNGLLLRGGYINQQGMIKQPPMHQSWRDTLSGVLKTVKSWLK